MFNGAKVQGAGIGIKYIFCDLLDEKKRYIYPSVAIFRVQ